jgi:hypothetical protein
MNFFKGLLYLIENDQPASPVLIEAPHYGAATAANEFANELGNRAASQRRFGPRLDTRDASDDASLRAVGGCR